MRYLYNFVNRGLLIILLASLNFAAVGSGYQVLLQGNRATAMGNLGVGLRPDATSLFFNPGALSLMTGNEVMFGINLINSNIAFWDSETTNSNYSAVTDNPLGTPFHIFAVWGPAGSKWKFGLGTYTPFGSGVNWGTEWKGRYLLDEISLEAIYTQATVSYRIFDDLSIGAGIVAMFGNVNLKRVVDASSGGEPALIELDGKSKTGFGYNIGLYWAASEQWQIGLNYRSRIDAELDNGDVAFFNTPTSLAGLFTPNKFKASLPLPSSTSLGVNFTPDKKISVGIEANYIGWSAYKSLNFDFADENLAVQDTESPRNYQDSWVFHLGGEYSLGIFKVRAGAYYDISPVQEGFMTPETPDANRIGLTAGFGYEITDHFQFDVSFLFIAGQQRTQTIQASQSAGTYPSATSDTYAVEPGTYKLRAYIPGISVAYKF